jgi:hypothetical protein
MGDFAYVQHTESGITNSDSFINYINAIIVPYVNGMHSALIVDSWGAHLTPKVREFCRSLNIRLVQVPKRGTDTLQPLDVGIFGLAKRTVYAEAKEELFELVRAEEDRWHATSRCVEALSVVSCRAVQRGWKLVFPFWEDELRKANALMEGEIE